MAKKNVRTTLVVTLIVILVCVGVMLLPTLSLITEEGDFGSRLLLFGPTILGFLPLVGTLNFDISVKKREEKGRYLPKANRTARILSKIMVVVYVAIPLLLFAIAMVVGAKDSPTTEGASGVIIYGGIPIPCGIPAGIPWWGVAAFGAVGIGFLIVPALFKKIDEMFR